ncbi:hypothetical protein T439DRAFT_326833 [Meredithblackwellia eburnea MCA 4105]
MSSYEQPYPSNSMRSNQPLPQSAFESSYDPQASHLHHDYDSVLEKHNCCCCAILDAIFCCGRGCIACNVPDRWFEPGRWCM